MALFLVLCWLCFQLVKSAMLRTYFWLSCRLSLLLVVLSTGCLLMVQAVQMPYKQAAIGAVLGGGRKGGDRLMLAKGLHSVFTGIAHPMGGNAVY
jgi:hypothetical protein